MLMKRKRRKNNKFNLIVMLLCFVAVLGFISQLIPNTKDNNQVELPNENVIYSLNTEYLYSDGSDNLLLIDWNSIDSIKAFLSIVKNINSVWVQEFLYDTYTSIVHDVSGNAYANEFLFTIYNDPK